MDVQSFRLSRTARSFHLETEAGPFSPSAIRRLAQGTLLFAQVFLAPCLCHQGLVNVFFVACIGLVLDLLVCDRRKGLFRPLDWLFAFARTTLAVAALS